MRVGRASRYRETQPLPYLPFRRGCTRRCSALFERLRKHINRQEREIERLPRQLDEAQKELTRDEKRIAELEKENSKLKRDLESKVPQTDVSGSLSTPSAMQPAYSKPPRSKHRRKPGRKKGHPGVCRPTPARIDQILEHTLTECPTCHNPLGEPCGQHSQIVEDIPPVQPIVKIDYGRLLPLPAE